MTKTLTQEEVARLSTLCSCDDIPLAIDRPCLPCRVIESHTALSKRLEPAEKMAEAGRAFFDYHEASEQFSLGEIEDNFGEALQAFKTSEGS